MGLSLKEMKFDCVPENFVETETFSVVGLKPKKERSVVQRHHSGDLKHKVAGSTLELINKENS